MIFIGADGGGTGTALAAFENGKCVARAEAGPLNYRFIGPEAAAGNLAEGVAALGIDEKRVLALGLADPALDDAAEEDDALARRFYGILGETLPFPVHARSDVRITLFGLTGGEGPGALLIAGTGAMGIAVDAEGSVLLEGGWGRLTGDEGSGYYIATEGIRAGLRAADGIAPPTALTDALLGHFGVDSPRRLIGVFYGEDEPDIASFAEEVARCADAGDGTALAILDDAASFLASYAEQLIRRSGSRRIGVYGSVLTKNRRIRAAFERKLRERVGEAETVEPSVSAEEAAALYAQAQVRKEKETGK